MKDPLPRASIGRQGGLIEHDVPKSSTEEKIKKKNFFLWTTLSVFPNVHLNGWMGITSIPITSTVDLVPACFGDWCLYLLMISLCDY